MPNLSNKGVHEFWHEYHDPPVYKAVSFMENVEDWSLDGDPGLEQAITGSVATSRQKQYNAPMIVNYQEQPHDQL